MHRPAPISLFVLVACASPQPDTDLEPLEIIAFGSCARQDREQPIRDTILARLLRLADLRE